MELEMAIIISNIRAGLETSEFDVINSALKYVGVGRGALLNGYIVKSSVDARHRNNLCLVYSVGLELKSDEANVVAKAADHNVVLRTAAAYEPKMGNEKLSARPVIIGFGPAGMFAGLILAKHGYRPLIVERGAPVEKRVAAVGSFFETGRLDTQSNVQFGEGGAGTFSDGKLTTRIGDPRCETVLRQFVENGAPEAIMRAAKPHIGTDNLRLVVRSIRNQIIGCGGEIRFETKLDGIGIKNERIFSVTLDGADFKTDVMLLAIGHSARDTFQMLLDSGVTMEPKPFSAGVRIEHLQSEIDKALYGSLAGHPALPHGEYQLSLREGGRAVYTFCMCPGGSVVAATSEQGGLVTNGMSLYSRDGKNANSALVVSVSPADFGDGPLAGVAFQRRLEQAAFVAGGANYRAPYQTVGSFLGGSSLNDGRVEPTYPLGVTPCHLDSLFPDYISDMLRGGLRNFDRKLHGFAASDAIITGVETRTSSPVRIPRGETLEASGIGGLYPVGEGAGYAGGIMSAAVDGLRAAEAVMAKYAPMD
jgi:uncharacterized FAD-dependent dehydrogenase